MVGVCAGLGGYTFWYAQGASYLSNDPRACVNCHVMREQAAALMAQFDAIKATRAAGATDADLQASLELQRAAQWRIDFIAAENSMGFHAPQEAARILGEAIDLARQGEVAALKRGAS